VLVLAACHLSGIDIEKAQPLLSILATLGAVLILLSIVRRHFSGLTPGIAAVFGFYLADRYTAIHTTSGMETQIFVFLLCGSTMLALRFARLSTRRNALMLAVSMFAAVLCRPDAVVYLAGTWLALAAACLWRVIPTRSVIVCAGAFAVLIAAYAAIKYTYFGYLLPNPFYVKSRPENALAFAGASDVWNSLKHVFLVMWPALIAVVAVPGREVWRRLTDPNGRVAALLIVMPPALALCYYLTIIHEMGFASRFCYPAFFYIALAVAVTVDLAVRSASAKGYARLAVGLTTLCAAVVLIGRADWRLRIAQPNFITRYHASIAEALASTGLGARATVITTAAGLIPYRSRFNHIDPVGLTDNYLSGRQSITVEQFENYLWSSHADVYIGWEPPAGYDAASNHLVSKTHYVAEVLLSDAAYALQWNHPRYGGITQDLRRALLERRMSELRDRWVWLGEIDCPELYRYLSVRSFAYVRRDSKHRAELAAALNRLIGRTPDRVELD
jgi:hypothetical protein